MRSPLCFFNREGPGVSQGLRDLGKCVNLFQAPPFITLFTDKNRHFPTRWMEQGKKLIFARPNVPFGTGGPTNKKQICSI